MQTAPHKPTYTINRRTLTMYTYTVRPRP
jgi:hypothetical protein